MELLGSFAKNPLYSTRVTAEQVQFAHPPRSAQSLLQGDTRAQSQAQPKRPSEITEASKPFQFPDVPGDLQKLQDHASFQYHLPNHEIYHRVVSFLHQYGLQLRPVSTLLLYIFKSASVFA